MCALQKFLVMGRVLLDILFHLVSWYELALNLLFCILLLRAGTFGLVDYTNYEDMKYAVSYYMTHRCLYAFPNDLIWELQFFSPPDSET